MRAVVVGGSGQIGGCLLRFLRERGHAAVGTFASSRLPGLVHLDAADHDAAAAWLLAQRPDVVLYPAGFTWVDGCEKDPKLARRTNLEQPLNLARTTAEIRARFVYFSTDYVFDGLAGPYGESDLARPLSVYGAAKRDAEIALAEVLGDALLVVRTCWVFGPESQGKNFAYQVRRALRDEKTLTCPSDQTSSPTYGPDIAEAVVRLVELGRSGLIHVAGPEVVDRVGFARSLAAAFHLDSAWIEGKSTAELGQVAPRPLKGGLLTRRLDELLPGLMRPLSQTLPEFQAWLAVSDKWAPPSTYDEPGAERVAD